MRYLQPLHERDTIRVVTTSGCGWLLRASGAIAAFIVAALSFQQAVWYHRHIDELMRIPFVFGAAIIGLLFVAAGIYCVIPSQE